MLLFTVLLSVLWVWHPISAFTQADGLRLTEDLFKVYSKRFRPNYGAAPVQVGVSSYILAIQDVSHQSMVGFKDFFSAGLGLYITSSLTFLGRNTP